MAPNKGWYVPLEQEVHETAGSCAPSPEEYVPLLQGVQLDWLPARDWYVPAAHDSQAQGPLAPNAVWNLPALHGVHDDSNGLPVLD